MSRPETPALTVDIIIEMHDQPNRPIVLIERKYQPHGWAIPGGFVDVGETVSTAAVREALEETCLEVELVTRLGVVDKIELDDKGEVYYHFVIIQYLADMVSGEMCPMDDALEAEWVTLDQLKDYDLTNSLKDFLIEIGMYSS